jgi:LysM repeat protein
MKKDMTMKRNIKTRLFSIAVLITLTGVASGCSLFKKATPETSVTQPAQVILFTPVVLTPTPILETSLTPNPENMLTNVTTPTPASDLSDAEPTSSQYTLQSGEYPYCIARRFNIHPDDLMALNNLKADMLYSPGLILNIPETKRPFPGTRALRPHPTTYIIPKAQMTIYDVACYFGDVRPNAILKNNGLTSPLLTLGQTLQIP